MLYCLRPLIIRLIVRQWLATCPFRPSYPFAQIVQDKVVNYRLRLLYSWFVRAISMNANPFTLVSISILRSIPIPFFTKVYRTMRGEPPIKLDKLILLISNVYDPKVETFLRGPLFLNLCLKLLIPTYIHRSLELHRASSVTESSR